MSKFFLYLLAVLPMAVSAGSGQYHVCTDANGKKTFTSKPCKQGDAAEVRTYDVSSGVSSSSRLTTENPVYQKMKADNRRVEIGRAIKQHNKNIEGYASLMSKQLAVLKIKKSRANNNIAGAAWEVSISEEMTAVTNKYTTLIGIERDRLNDLNLELGGL